jgi:hypothetical protein
MTNKPKSTTKPQVDSKPKGPRKISLSGHPEKVARESIAKLKAICDEPVFPFEDSEYRLPTGFTIIFENESFDVKERSTMSVEEKQLLKIYKNYLEIAQNNLAVALCKIDDADFIREIVDNVASIKGFSAAIGGCDVDRMMAFVGRDYKSKQGTELNKAKTEYRKRHFEMRREIILQKCKREELSTYFKFADSIKSEINAELQNRGYEPVSAATLQRDIRRILKE